MATTLRSFAPPLDVVGAALVISGVVLKNSDEQLNDPNNPSAMSALGMAAFLGGWAAVAHSFNTAGAWAASSAIAASVLMMKKTTRSKAAMNPVYPLAFATGWAALGYMSGPNPVYRVAVPALVLGSMMGVLPQQRSRCVVDGPGMPMFTTAWALLLLNRRRVSLIFN